MGHFLLLFLGGGIGTLLRYGFVLIRMHLSLNPLSTLGQTLLPWPTLVVNVIGSFLIGLFYSLSARFGWSADVRLMLTTGLCGGFTTFSTFSYEGLQLVRAGHIALAVTYLLLSVLLGFGAVCFGAWVADK